MGEQRKRVEGFGDQKSYKKRVVTYDCECAHEYLSAYYILKNPDKY